MFAHKEKSWYLKKFAIDNEYEINFCASLSYSIKIKL